MCAELSLQECVRTLIREKKILTHVVAVGTGVRAALQNVDIEFLLYTATSNSGFVPILSREFSYASLSLSFRSVSLSRILTVLRLVPHISPCACRGCRRSRLARATTLLALLSSPSLLMKLRNELRTYHLATHDQTLHPSQGVPRPLVEYQCRLGSANRSSEISMVCCTRVLATKVQGSTSSQPKSLFPASKCDAGLDDRL